MRLVAIQITSTTIAGVWVRDAIEHGQPIVSAVDVTIISNLCVATTAGVCDEGCDIVGIIDFESLSISHLPNLTFK